MSFSSKILYVGSLGFFSLFVFSGCPSSQVRSSFHGQIESDEIDVASRLAGRIRKVYVSPGQKVKKGDILVEFDDDVIAAKRNRAEALIKAAQSQKRIAESAVRPEEKAQAKSAMDAAERQMKFAKTSLDRLKTLTKEGAISQQQLDDVTTKYEMARDAFDAARAKFELAEKGAREEQKTAAGALVEEGFAGLAEVRAYEVDLKLRSPVDAEIVKILNREGELVPQGYPVMTLVTVDKPWAVFYLSEEHLKDVPVGKDVKIRLPFLEQSLNGRVSFVSPLGTFATFVTTQEKSAFDLRTFEVHVDLSGNVSTIRPGMTAILDEGGAQK